MGFEQLAALKRELVAQAELEKKQKARKAPAAARKPARQEPVDPVVITISRLQKQFPLAFPKKPAAKLPLKLGIHKDLYAQAEALKLTNAEIKEAVKTWCQGSRYWACVTEGAPRLDLAGAPAGEVTAAEALYAKQLAERRRANASRSRRADKAQQAKAKQEGAPASSPAADAPAPDTAPPDGTAADTPASDTPNTAPDQTTTP